MNLTNRTLYIADNLEVLRGIDSECVDLIYLDPPFNSKRKYEAAKKSIASGASFKDVWDDDDVNSDWFDEVAKHNPHLYQLIQISESIYDKSMKSYLLMLSIRMIEMYRVLKSTGSIYLHCDPTASHYIKLIMDSIFGKQNFINEIVYKRTGSNNSSTNSFGRIHDTILFYIKGGKATWNSQYEAHDPKHIKNFYRHQDTHGQYGHATLICYQSKGEAGQPWHNIDPAKSGSAWNAPRRGEYAKYIEENFIPNYRQITSVHKRLDALDKAGLIYWPKKGKIPRLKFYLDGSQGRVSQDIITNIKIGSKHSERIGYPTQKPLALLELFIKSSSNKGDLVLDPFCGCATTCVASELLDRQWVGIDISLSLIHI